MMRKLSFVLLAGVVSLAACGETKLLGRTAPDETTVVDGPTLALPPSFDLRPPRDAKDYDAVLQEQANVAVHGLVTGVSGSVPANADALQALEKGPAAAVPAGDAWLVKQAGAVQPGIRDELKTEDKAAEAKEAAEKPKKKGLFSRWFGKSSD